jgi:hypothetical protein
MLVIITLAVFAITRQVLMNSICLLEVWRDPCPGSRNCRAPGR